MTITTNHIILTIIAFISFYILIELIRTTIDFIKQYIKLNKEINEAIRDIDIIWKMSKNHMKEHDPELYEKTYNIIRKLNLNIDEK